MADSEQLIPSPTPYDKENIKKRNPDTTDMPVRFKDADAPSGWEKGYKTILRPSRPSATTGRD